MNHKINQVLTLVLTIAALMVGQSVWAQSKFTISAPTHNISTHVTSFKVTRTTNTSTSEQVYYCTVSLSAIAGQHYTNKTGHMSFDAYHNELTVEVTETPDAIDEQYHFQTGTSRSYRLVIYDKNGFQLAYRDRDIDYGNTYLLSGSYVNKSITDLVYFQSGSVKSGSNNKYLDVAHSGTNGTEKMIDDGYDYNDNTLCTVSTNSLYNSSSALRTYLARSYNDYKMYATVYFQQREVNDGYQYIQILADNATTYDGKDGDGKIDNGPTKSLYKAAFILTKNEDVCTSWKYQAFPHRTDDHTSSTEFDHSDSYLYAQAFKSNTPSYRATTSGSLVLAPTVNDINVRFDANGGGDDTWYLKNLKVRLALVDTKAPTVLDNYKVSNIRNTLGANIYVSVPFSEIVKVTGTPKLNTTWGELSYCFGDGSNVLTFSGNISSDASGKFTVKSYSGTITDLAENQLNTAGNTIYHEFNISLTSSSSYNITYDLAEGTVSVSNPTSYTYETATITLNNPTRFGYYFDGWTGSNGSTPQTTVTIAQHSHGNKSYTANWTQVWTGSGTPGEPYIINSTKGLDLLAQYVNSGNTCKDLYFQLDGNIEYTYNKAWEVASNENNYTCIGNDDYKFQGTFDGQGNTISGIRIYKGDYSFQGLFGNVGSGGTVKRVNLSDARITGRNSAGGIAGNTFGATIEDCTVGDDVCIHAVVNNASYHGGIVGHSQAGPVRRCVSRARLTVADGKTDCQDYGGIVGYNNHGTITDCIADGVVIPDVKGRGAITGYQNNNGTFTRNYYHNCKVASDAVTPSGVGLGTQGSTTTSDVDGIKPLWAITLPNHASVVRTGTALPGTDNATYDNGADINGVPYAKGSSTVNLSYNPANITDGYDVLLSVNRTVNGNAVTFTDNDDHTYTIPSMPAADISVSVTQIPVISYIDADGNLQSHGCTPIVSDIHTYQTPGRTDAWYVVNNDVTDDYAWSSKFEDKAVHIILCDGKTFYRKTSATGYSAIEVINGSLSIYGQSLGTGRLIATSRSTAIFVKSDINFNGGIVSSSTTNYNSVYTQNGDITIRRGNITAQAATYGINSKSGTIILGCSSTADHITANGYYAEKGVKVADGQTLTDGISSHTFTGTLSDNQLTALAGKTLMKSLGNVAYLDGNGQAQTCTDYTILWDSTIPVDGSDEGSIGTADQDSWYVASTDYTFGKKLNALGHVHLILLDGTTFTVNGTETGLNSKDLSIYGQSLGTGTLTASATDKAMFVDGNLVINGGTTHATGGNYGIYVDGGNLTVNGGSINATGTTSGIYVAGNLTLGWNKLSDRITANSYNCTGTISVKEGQQLHNGSSLLSGTLYNHNGGNPTGDLSVLAGLTLKPAVPYITADGTTQYCGEYTVLESSNEQFADYGTYGQENWYVVSGNVTFDGQLRFNDSHSHLIVCDGAHLTASAPVASEDAIYGYNGGITIYGQTLGTGTITANGASNGCGIGSGSNITINGGTIIATGMYGFYSFSDIIINRGTVTVTGTDNGIHADGNNVTINGGIVNATGGIVGIYAGKTITLGWTNPTDRITVSSYAVGDIIASGHYYIRVKNGQTLTDGTNGYSGTLYDINNGTITGDASVLAGQTLQPCCSITLPAHVIATGVISQNGTTAYALPAADITLSAEANFALANVEVNGNSATDNGDGTWSFTMPAEDVTVTATVSVPYIDADGTTQYCASYTLIESSQYNVSLGSINNDEAWYVVPAGEVTISGQLYCSGKAVHLILCDGAELTVTNSSSSNVVKTPYSLTIYGQSAQSGRLTATATGSAGCGIMANEGDITVNGGIISATSNGQSGIEAQFGSVTINRGSVTATSNSGSFSYGIQANNNVTINGGIVSATGNSDGIYAFGGTITLGWTNATDRIYASSYNRNPVVKSGQTFTDGTNAYSGSVNSSNIAGMTLQPAVALAMNGAGIMTYASPYALDLSNVNAYVVSSYSNTNSTLTLSKVTEAPANTGLLLKTKEDSQKGKTVALPLKASAEAIASNLLVGVTDGATVVPQTDGDYTNFILAKGKYGIDWYTLSEAGAIGANKAYLQLLTADLTNFAREFTWVYDDGETTEMNEELRMKNEEFNATGWYTLEGRKLDGKPTKKGLYIHNGRKVLVP